MAQLSEIFISFYYYYISTGKSDKFLLTLIEALALSSAHARPIAQLPINLSGNFIVHIPAKLPSNISLSPSKVISNVSAPYDKPFWVISLLSAQNLHIWGSMEGSPGFFLSFAILISLLEKKLRKREDKKCC